MWKYLVTYILTSWHSVECPDYKPTTDEFGRTTWPMTHCLVNHMGCDKDTVTKVFVNRDSALVFYSHAIDQAKVEESNTGFGGLFSKPVLSDIKIDSVKK